MPSVIHGRDKITDLPEAPSATENEGTQASYGISLHGNMVEDEREKGEDFGACPQTSFSKLHPLERQKTLFWNMG